MEDVSSKSLMDILRPYDILSCATGARFFKCRSRVKSKIGLIIPLLLNAYYIFKWYMELTGNGKYKKVYKFQFVKSLHYGSLTLRYLMVALSIILGLRRNKAWDNVVKSLNEVNKTLEALGSKAQFRRMYIISSIELTTFFVYLTISVGCFAYLFSNNMNQIDLNTLHGIMFMLSYIYSEILEYAVTMDFVTLVRLIKSKQQRANDLLNDVNILPLSSIAMELIEHRETNNSLFNKIFTIAPLLEGSKSHLLVKRKNIFRIRRLLRTVRHIYLELYRVSKKLSTLYGIQMSIKMAMNMFDATCYLFVLYVYTKYNILDGNIFVNNVCLIMTIINISCIFDCSQIIIVNYICDRAVLVAQKTSEIIHTFYAEYTDEEIQQEVNMFSLQMLHCSSAYSAFGLYNFNCKYICSCIGIIATYLVIIIQMTQQQRKNE